MPPKFQLLALLAFAVATLFLENQIQKLEESRGKLGKIAPEAPSIAPPVPVEAAGGAPGHPRWLLRGLDSA